jgi:methylenetetrahydrofolate reductase (NADPH)
LRTFRQALQGPEPAITVELDSREGRDAAEVCRLARELSAHADAIQVTEQSTAAGVSPLALAALLLRAGVDPIPSLSGRDRNRIALLSDLLGLRALGVTSLMLEDRTGASDSGGPSPVLDVDGRELITMASELNEDEWAGGGHEFLIGNRIDLPASDDAWDAQTLSKRASAGMRFLQIRADAGLASLGRYLEFLVDHRITWRCSIMIALEMNQDIGHCADKIRAAASIPGVSGIHLLTAGDSSPLEAVISRSGIRPERN